MACAALLLVLTATESQAFFGRSRKASSEIEAVVKRASELAREAELAWEGDQDAAKAVALYEQAIDLCLEAEENYPKSDLGQVRFRRAFCETQIDQVKFDAATGKQRRVAVMDGAPEASAPTNRTAAAEPPEARPAAAADTEVSVAEELAWARDMLDANGSEEARASLMNVLKADPDNRPARVLLAVLECKKGAFQDALFILEDLQAEQEDETVQLLIAGAFLGAGQSYRAMLELDKVLAKKPSHPDALMNMAYLTMELSAKPAEAELYYRLAVTFGAQRDAAFEKRLGF